MEESEITQGARFGIVTALPKEFAATCAMLSGAHDFPIKDDPNDYVIGTIPAADKSGNHVVVVTFLKRPGNNSAAAAASHLVRSFPNVQDVLMVGIAGGVPRPEDVGKHVRLGDIVVSSELGVIQYDDVKLAEGVARIRGSSMPPSAAMLGKVRLLEAKRLAGNHPWESHIGRADSIEGAKRPDPSTDRLFSAEDPQKEISHPHDDPLRRPSQPKIYYGRIGSANTLLKDPKARDALGKELDLLAFEMEGSGIADGTWMDGKWYILIRGISDYCDLHKNDPWQGHTDVWQGYAAVAAAAYARSLIELFTAPREGPSPIQPKELIKPEEVPDGAAVVNGAAEEDVYPWTDDITLVQLLYEDIGYALPVPIPAFPLDTVPERMPFDIGTIWGLERGRFIGIVAGPIDAGVYHGLVQVERVLRYALSDGACDCTLPVRCWVRVDPFKKPNWPEREDDVWDSAISPDSPAVRYLKGQGLGDSMIPGIFIEIPAGRFDECLAITLQSYCRTLMTAALSNRQAAIVIYVSGDDPHNSVDVARKIKARLATLAPDLPGPVLLGLRYNYNDEGKLNGAIKAVDPFAPPPDLGPGLYFFSWVHEAAIRGREELADDQSAKEYVSVTEQYRHLHKQFNELGEQGAALDVVRDMDSLAHSASPGFDRQFIQLVARYLPERLPTLVRAYTRSTRRAARRDALIIASHAQPHLADGLLDIWVDEIESDSDRLPRDAELEADGKLGGFVDDLALALIRRLMKMGKSERIVTLINQLEPDLSPAIKNVWTLYQHDIREEEFSKFLSVAEAKEFQLLIRAGLDPKLPAVRPDNQELQRPEMWWFISAMSPQRERIREMLKLDPVQRAVLGLCTSYEWARISYDPVTKEKIFRWRRTRPIDFPTTYSRVLDEAVAEV